VDAGQDERGRQVRARILKLKRAFLIVGAVIGVAAPAAQGSVLTGRLLVTLRQDEGTSAHASANAVLARAHARRTSPLLAPLRLFTVRPTDGSLHGLATRLRTDPTVAHVEVERRATIRSNPGDPALTTQEGAAGTPSGTPVEWWAFRENFPAAWDVTTGSGAVIGVIDTGIDGGHPEFAGRIKATVDQDAETDNPGHDDAGHGTHVASLACANGGNGVGLAGGAYGCSLVVERSDLSDFSVAQSIVDATDRGADAINMSFGTDGSRPAARGIVDAIDYAYKRGVVLVAAAADDPIEEQGDPSNVLQPTGTGPDITKGKGLDVTAASVQDQRASFAGRGTQISMAAYGTYGAGDGSGPRGIFGAFPGNVTSLETGSLATGDPPCNCRAVFNGDSRYAYVGGTSMAAPQVTAVAAMVRHLNPDLSAADIIELIKRTAQRAGGGWNAELGWGILDAGAAITAAQNEDRRAPASRLKTSHKLSGGRITLRLSGTDTAPPGVVASGIARFEIWRSLNGGKARRLRSTTARTLRVAAHHGARYAFYSIAVDKAGNREHAPGRADARFRLR
jgi:subtilisin family serine protease